MIPISQTLPDVNLDEILASLDADTRDYLLLLLNDGAQGLGSERKGRELAQAIRRLEPTAKYAREINEGAGRAAREPRARRAQLLAADRRARQARHAARELRAELQRGVRHAGRARTRRCGRSCRSCPGTLQTTQTTLGKVETLADELGPTLEALRPGGARARRRRCARRARSCASRRRSSATRSARSRARRCRRCKELRPAMRDLAAATPDLTRSFKVVNRLLNEVAYNPPGDEARRACCSGSRGSTTRATRSSPPRTRTARSAAAWSCSRARPRSCWTRSRRPTRSSARSSTLLNAPAQEHDLPASDPAPAAARRLSHGQGRSLLRQDRRDGAVRAVVLRAAAVPVARVRRPGAAEAEGLPLPHVVRRGRPARAGGRRADLRRAGRQGQDDQPDKQTGRADVEIQLQLALRAAAVRTRGRSCARRRCWARPTWSSRRADARRGPIPEGGELPSIAGVRHGRAGRDPALVRSRDARGVPGLDADAGAGDRGPRAGPQRRARQPRRRSPRTRRRSSTSSTARRARSRGSWPTRASSSARCQRARRAAALADREHRTRCSRPPRRATASCRRRSARCRRSRTSRARRSSGWTSSRARPTRSITQLRPAARELSPTLEDLADLAPDLKNLLEQLQPLIDASKEGFPAAEQVLEDTRPLLGQLDPGDRAAHARRWTSSGSTSAS